MSLVTLSRTPAVSDAQQYRLLCAAMLPFFLAAAVAGRLWRIVQSDPSGAGRSILAEARTASANALLFAFQG